MRIMSVDFGDSRTGIAVCDKSEMLASPLTVITEYNFQRCAEKVAELAQKEKAELIVVGYPKNMNGTTGERAEKCAEFARITGELSTHNRYRAQLPQRNQRPRQKAQGCCGRCCRHDYS